MAALQPTRDRDASTASRAATDPAVATTAAEDAACAHPELLALIRALARQAAREAFTAAASQHPPRQETE